MARLRCLRALQLIANGSLPCSPAAPACVNPPVLGSRQDNNGQGQRQVARRISQESQPWTQRTTPPVMIAAKRTWYRATRFSYSTCYSSSQICQPAAHRGDAHQRGAWYHRRVEARQDGLLALRRNLVAVHPRRFVSRLIALRSRARTCIATAVARVAKSGPD